MEKNSFIVFLAEELKNYGYTKKGQYWYKTDDRWIYCVNVQGSQWSKEDYYVNIGAANRTNHSKTPSILHWMWVHRCRDIAGREINISVSDVIKCAESLFREFGSERPESLFYENHNAVNINGRMFF